MLHVRAGGKHELSTCRGACNCCHMLVFWLLYCYMLPCTGTILAQTWRLCIRNMKMVDECSQEQQEVFVLSKLL